ncbi:hypothetical protein HMPREF3156_00719 [Neisseria sp. HMSC06F02]|nr:hypothetical protein HMPREF3156_00719 [Neisseria sp. HMSC06F02]
MSSENVSGCGVKYVREVLIRCILQQVKMENIPIIPELPEQA